MEICLLKHNQPAPQWDKKTNKKLNSIRFYESKFAGQKTYKQNQLTSDELL